MAGSFSGGSLKMVGRASLRTVAVAVASAAGDAPGRSTRRPMAAAVITGANARSGATNTLAWQSESVSW
jgi:hypothetical protein